MRQHEGLQRAAAVLLQATLAMGCLIGCGVATRPPDGTFDLPHFASQVPGVDPKDVEVSVMDNALTFKGERQADPDSAGKDYFVREVAYGAFQRSFPLPEGVDAAQVEAKDANGMLEVRVPAPRVATPRTIEVKAA